MAYPRLDGTGLTTLLTRLAAVIKQGHTVVDSTGTALAQRDKLKFVNATITDDSTNNVTVVTVTGGGADVEIIAADFDSTESYAVGDYCTKDGSLYKFTTAHTGAWSDNDVDEVAVMDEVPDAMTTAELETLENAFSPNPLILPSILSPQDLQDIEDAFVINSNGASESRSLRSVSNDSLFEVAEKTSDNSDALYELAERIADLENRVTALEEGNNAQNVR